MTFYSVSSLIGGVFFGAIAKRAKNYMLFISLVGVAISALGIYFAGSYAMVCFFLAVGGLTSTFVLPACNNAYYAQVPPQRSFLASSLTLSGLNIGAFLIMMSFRSSSKNPCCANISVTLASFSFLDLTGFLLLAILSIRSLCLSSICSGIRLFSFIQFSVSPSVMVNTAN